MTTTTPMPTPEEQAVRDRLHGLHPQFPAMIDIAVYGVTAGMFTATSLPRVPEPQRDVGGNLDQWFAAYAHLEQFLHGSGAWRAFYAEQGEYPIDQVLCPSWCPSEDDHDHDADLEPPTALVYHDRKLLDVGEACSIGIVAEQTAAGIGEPYLSVPLPNGGELGRMTSEQVRSYARALLAAADEFEKLTK